MDMEITPFQVAEVQDALTACDDLRMVIARLKRLGLLTESEDQEVRQSIRAVTATLEHKIPEEEEEEGE